jgi:hypothetical protein
VRPSNYRQDAQRIRPPRRPLRCIGAKQDSAFVVRDIGVCGHLDNRQRLARNGRNRAFLGGELRQRKPCRLVTDLDREPRNPAAAPVRVNVLRKELAAVAALVQFALFAVAAMIFRVLMPARLREQIGGR